MRTTRQKGRHRRVAEGLLRRPAPAAGVRRGQADTRHRASGLFNVQEAIDETAVGLFDAVKEMLQEKTGKKYMLDTDAMRERVDNARLNEKGVREAVYDALDHSGGRHNNLKKLAGFLMRFLLFPVSVATYI